jgi:RNA polymerase sigma-70 factor (ECF subfamily)
MSSLDILTKIYLAKNGDKNAFADIYEAYYQPVFRFALFRLAGDKDRAEDIVSETFLKWFKSLHKYNPEMAKPLNYLFLIASRIIINQGTKKKADLLSEDDEEFIKDNSESVLDILNTEYEMKNIQKVIDENLNDIEKQIIYLKYTEDKTNTEISEITGKNQNNLRQIEFRALNKIRKNINI